MNIQEHIKQWGKEWLLIEHLYSKFASEYGFTFAACKALDRIYHDESCTQKYLCQVLSMPKQTVSNFMTQLMRDGFVERVISAADRRICEYHLTAKGYEVCEGIFKRLDQIEYEAFAKLSKAERDAFTTINQKITVLIQQGMEKGGDHDGCSKYKRHDQGITRKADH